MSVALATVARIQADGEVMDDAALLAELTREGADVETLLNRLGRAAIEAEDFAAVATARIQQITARKQRFERRRETYRAAMFGMMDALGIKHHKSADFTATVSSSHQHVEIIDEAAIPDQFWNTTRKIDKAAVTAAMKAGDVPGAAWNNGQTTLFLRSK